MKKLAKSNRVKTTAVDGVMERIQLQFNRDRIENEGRQESSDEESDESVNGSEKEKKIK